MLQSYKPALTSSKPVSYMPHDMTGNVIQVNNSTGTYRAEYDPIVKFGVVYLNGTVKMTPPANKFEMTDTFEFSICLKTQSACVINYGPLTITFQNETMVISSLELALNMQTGTWYHVLMTPTPGVIYLNGTIVATYTLPFGTSTPGDYITMSGNFSMYNFNIEPGRTYRPATLLMVPSPKSKFLLNGQINPRYFKRRFISSYTDMFVPNPDGFRDGLAGSVYTSSYWYGWVQAFSSITVNPPNGIIQVVVGTTYSDGATAQEVALLGNDDLVYTGNRQSFTCVRAALVVPVFIHLRTVSGSVCVVDSNRLLWDNISS